MHQKLRRGLLGTFFAGGLLALGATAANADTTVTGTVAVESESVSADVIASTSLGLLGGPTTSGSSEITAVAEVNLGNAAGAPTGTGTTAAAALVDVNLGNTGTATGNGTTADALVDVSLGESGLLGDDGAAAEGAVNVGLGTGTDSSAGLGVDLGIDLGTDTGTTPPATDPGDGSGTGSDPTDGQGNGSGTDGTGTDGNTGGQGTGTDANTGGSATGAVSGGSGIVVLPAGAVTTDGSAAANVQKAALASGQASSGTQSLANTGADAGLLPLSLALLAIGMLMVIRRRKA